MIELFFETLKVTDDTTQIKAALQSFFKEFCTTKADTSKYIQSFTSGIIDLVQYLESVNHNNNATIDLDSINLLRKSTISIGLIARYSPYASSFKEHLRDIFANVVEPLLLFKPTAASSQSTFVNLSNEISALNIEALKCYSMMLQSCYDQEMMDPMSFKVMDIVQKNHIKNIKPIDPNTVDLNAHNIHNYLNQIISDLVATLIQVSPGLIIENNTLISYLVDSYLSSPTSATEDQDNQELISILGHYLQLFIIKKFQPTSSSKQTSGSMSNGQQEQDEEQDGDENDRDYYSKTVMVHSKSIEKCRKEFANVNLFRDTKVLVSVIERIQSKLLATQEEVDPSLPKGGKKSGVLPPTSWNESYIILLGIILSYSCIHPTTVNGESNDIINFIFNIFLNRIEQLNDQFKNGVIGNTNQFQTVDKILNTLSFVFANLPTSSNDQALQSYLPRFLDIFIDLFSNVKNRLKEQTSATTTTTTTPASKALKKNFISMRENLCKCLGSMLRVYNHFFARAHDFVSFSHVLAEPLVMADFIYSLHRQLNNNDTDSMDIEKYKDDYSQEYFPKIFTSLISQLSLKFKTNINLSKSFLKSILHICCFEQKEILPYVERLVQVLKNIFVVEDLETYITYSYESILVLSKLATSSLSVSNNQDFEVIWNIFITSVNDQTVFHPLTMDVIDEIDQESMIRSKFALIEELCVIIKCNHRNQAKTTTELAEPLFKYLDAHVGVEEIIFDSDLFLRMSELSLVKSLLKYHGYGENETTHFTKCLELIDKAVESVKSNSNDDDEFIATIVDHSLTILNKIQKKISTNKNNNIYQQQEKINSLQSLISKINKNK
ncbi:hypothetical protein DFA_08532 [Cavenderia fasciculata]|uniref:Exportin-T n=1 Tax=Cavenderia fasciculata TaxID=261658 RepID=F4Q2X2_CACFS|nr:uncharacterized protein DFA_08532 [Cavenderia fasciculata]EGG17536.1 hypothetical protein DFA_08532 [Cavenderia fasciculata]|eukprot:XP_004356020.1 hypothetical protein DFA_08532 [Cavenderia fasciculata]